MRQMPPRGVYLGTKNIITKQFCKLAILLALLNFFQPDFAFGGPTVQAWARRFGDVGYAASDYAKEILVDGAGNVVVGAYSTDEGANTMVVIKYSNAGALLWTNLFPLGGEATSMAIDDNGNVYLTGPSWTSSSTGPDYVTIKVSSGGSTLWTNRYGGPLSGSDNASAVAVDRNGNAFVTGGSYKSGSGWDYATVAYSNSGVPLWTNRYDGGNGEDVAQAATVDNSGNAVVTGYSGDSVGYHDYVTIKYSNVGLPLWTNRYAAPQNNASYTAYALAARTDNSVIVSGGGSQGWATIAYSSAGLGLWTNRYGNSGSAQAISVDASGSVFVTGSARSSAGRMDLATVRYSSEGMPLWTNRYNATGGNGDIQATSIALDGNGNVFVSGFSSTAGIDPGYVTIGYSGAGTALWTNRYNGSGTSNDVANAVAADTNGNVFVTGFSWNGRDQDAITIGYSVEGLPLWTNRYAGLAAGSNSVTGLVVDSAGNACVTGTSRNGVTGTDYATVKYSSAGVPLWTNRYSGRPDYFDDYAQAVAVDAVGNVFVTGYSHLEIETPGYYFYTTIAYSGSGVPLWTNLYSAGRYDYAQAIAVDSSGDVLVTGYSSSSVSLRYEYATIKYSNAGVPLWTNRYNGLGTGDAYATAVAVDVAGNVFVTGYSSGNQTTNDFATVAYSPAGTPLWTNRFHSPRDFNSSSPTALAVDGAGNVFVTGRTQFTSETGFTIGAVYATIAYSGSGTPLWTNYYYQNGTASANAVAVDRSGNVFVTGQSRPGAQDLSDYATIAYSAAGTPLWTNRYVGPTNSFDVATAIAVAVNSNVIVTGYSPTQGNGYDFVTLGYSTTGVSLWTNRYNGPASGDDRPRTSHCLAVSPDGSMFVAGGSTGNNPGGPAAEFATVKYITLPDRVSGSNLVTSLQLGVPAPNSNTITFAGLPGNLYSAQFATNLFGPWIDLQTNMADTNGEWLVIDGRPGSRSGFYRSLSR